MSQALAAWLPSRGLEPGAKIAIMLLNVPQFAVTTYGVLRPGDACINVFPNELENVISQCPAVLECAATGLPDEKQLSGGERPKHIEFRDAPPNTSVGKILRRESRTAAH